ncbi:hypothetical protein E4U55_004075 [Claviceps digitariae]|nr:hypothetical protein E4U55_004075 [Claviceps digitariae]
MARQESSEKKFIMTDVEPGAKTGIYYIPICNLPFGTSWQDFKDWLRLVCDVDHVELFQSSTSGWIRLRGEENFNKAWCLLQNEYFRNRAIIATDRNRTESIRIKRLVDSRVTQFPVRGKVAATQAHKHDAMFSSASSCLQEGVPLTSTLSSDVSFRHVPTAVSYPFGPVAPVAVATSVAYGGMTVLEPYPTMPGPYPTMPEAYNTLAVTQNQALPYVPAFGYYELPPPALDTFALIPAAYSGYSPSFYGTTQLQYVPCHGPIDYREPGTAIHVAPIVPPSCHQGQAYAIDDGPKTVVVTSIQHKSRPSEVCSWIRHQIGEYSPAIMGIYVPRVESKGRLRGHAHLTLANSAAAEATVRILDQKLFQGRVISARLMAPDEKRSTDAARSKPGKDAQRSMETNHLAGPVIAHGSSTRKTDKQPCL